MGLKPQHCSVMLLQLLILLKLPLIRFSLITKRLKSQLSMLQTAPGPCNAIGEIQNHDHHNSQSDIRIEQVHSHTSSSHMHHIDPSLVVFFFIDDLKQGNTIPIYFPNRELSDSLPHLLSKQEANSIPFKSQEFEHLLQIFNFSQNSPQAIAMKETLEECEHKPIKGETKTCATSFESMLDFTQTIFGTKTKPKSFSTTHITKSNEMLQKYTIMGINEISAPKMVACHTMPYPYAIFYCHYQDSESKVFEVMVSGENGDKVEAIAVCHMDTSQWGHNHVAFKVLGVEPGMCPVCHFFPADNFVWVPSST